MSTDTDPDPSGGGRWGAGGPEAVTGPGPAAPTVQTFSFLAGSRGRRGRPAPVTAGTRPARFRAWRWLALAVRSPTVIWRSIWLCYRCRGVLPGGRARALADALAESQRAERAVTAALRAKARAHSAVADANRAIRHAQRLGAVGAGPARQIPPELT